MIPKNYFQNACKALKLYKFLSLSHEKEVGTGGRQSLADRGDRRETIIF